jgi:hypothetical protein
MSSRLKSYLAFMRRVIVALPRCEFRWVRPQPVLILDRDGAQFLRECLDLRCNVVPTRGESWLFWPAVRTFLGRLRALAARLVRRTRIGRWLVPLSWLQSRDYLHVCIKMLRPKVVLTFIDNFAPFYRLAVEFPDIAFITVQNGWRNSFAISPPYGAPANPAQYLAMAAFDRDLHVAKQFNPERIRVAGSLRYALWKRRSDRPVLPRVDVAVVSQWRSNIFGERCDYPGFRDAHSAMHASIARYVRERQLTIAIAGWCGGEQERAYYAQFYGADVTIYLWDSPACVYDVMASASFVFTLNSTAGREVIADGGRVLFCDYPCENHTFDDVPGMAMLYVINPVYQELAERADFVRALTPAQWDALLGGLSYLMPAAASVDACDVIRETVRHALSRTA